MIGIINKNKVKKVISISLLLLINFLFSYKYLDRVNDFPFLISLALTIFYFLLLTNSIKIRSEKILNILIYSSLILFIFFAFIIFNKIEVHTLNVDRWSVITSFWDSAFKGNYPYFAESHMGSKPGPMPIYFLLALPFYLIKELGYFSLLALPISVLILRKRRIPFNYSFLLIIFLLTSTFYLWEVSSRSNLLTNSFLILWLLTAFIYRTNNKWLFLYAVISGLLLSTRVVLIIPFIVFLIYSLRKREISIFNFTICAVITASTFVLTFLPFVYFYPSQFFEMNPFIVQSSFLIPSYYTYIFILIAFIISFFTKNMNDLYFFSGLALFIPILIYIIYQLNVNGFNTYYSGKADISYFIFCIPFFIIYLSNLNKLENS